MNVTQSGQPEPPPSQGLELQSKFGYSTFDMPAVTPHGKGRSPMPVGVLLALIAVSPLTAQTRCSDRNIECPAWILCEWVKLIGETLPKNWENWANWHTSPTPDMRNGKPRGIVHFCCVGLPRPFLMTPKIAQASPLMGCKVFHRHFATTANDLRRFPWVLRAARQP